MEDSTPQIWTHCSMCMDRTFFNQNESGEFRCERCGKMYVDTSKIRKAINDVSEKYLIETAEE